MRTISLWQPWAELIMRNLKQWETRSWPIEYRGPLAIHAAKRKFSSLDMSRESRHQMLLDEVDPFYLKFGCVLGFCEITECRPTEIIAPTLTRRELLYGNYDAGRYAWRLEHVVRLPKPVELCGHQGIFYWREGRNIFDGLRLDH